MSLSTKQTALVEKRLNNLPLWYL